MMFISYFFFSSRRRHTRFKCDWSSDVCSSDLRAALSATLALGLVPTLKLPTKLRDGTFRIDRLFELAFATNARRPSGVVRSEERRVGKERRSRWSPNH